jgi:hypothetical protein
VAKTLVSGGPDGAGVDGHGARQGIELPRGDVDQPGRQRAAIRGETSAMSWVKVDGLAAAKRPGYGPISRLSESQV